MKGIKWNLSRNRFITSVGLFGLVLVSTVSTALLPFYSAHATSAYDNAIQVVDIGDLELYNTGVFGSSNVDRFDVSTNWTQWITDSTYWCSTTGADPLETATSFEEEIFSTNGSWAVSINNDYYSGNAWSTIHIYWIPDPAGQLTSNFSDSPFQRYQLDTSGLPISHWQILPNVFGSGALSTENTTGFCGQNAGSVSSGLDISNEFGNTQKTSAGSSNVGVFIYNSTAVTYPSGYEGAELPASAVEPSTVYTPKVGYHTTDSNELNALYIGDTNITIPAGFEDGFVGEVIPYIKWTVYEADGTTVLDTKTTSLSIPYEFQLPGNDTYIFEVVFTSPPPPGLPILEPDNLRTVRFTINANGTFVAGGTALNECSVVDGVEECGEANPLEDCSTYGVDVGGYFQCIINNFGIWLRNTLIDLFVPRYSFYTAWVADFTSFLQTKLGFVYTSLATVTNIFTGIIASGSTTECSISAPGTLFGTTFSVNVCDFETIIGNTSWLLLQGLVISVTVIGLVFAAYRKYLEVVDHR